MVVVAESSIGSTVPGAVESRQANANSAAASATIARLRTGKRLETFMEGACRRLEMRAGRTCSMREQQARPGGFVRSFQYSA
jgi:hypothetical protein